MQVGARHLIVDRPLYDAVRPEELSHNRLQRRDTRLLRCRRRSKVSHCAKLPTIISRNFCNKTAISLALQLTFEMSSLRKRHKISVENINALKKFSAFTVLVNNIIQEGLVVSLSLSLSCVFVCKDRDGVVGHYKSRFSFRLIFFVFKQI